MSGSAVGDERGWLVVLLAGPKTGKTAFAVNGVASSVAARGGRVLVVSAEMSAEELADRALTAQANGSVDPSHLVGAADAMSRWDMTVDARSRSFEAVAAKARSLGKESPMSLVVVDYLQLFGSGLDNRTLDIEHTITGLKGLARELNAPVLLLVQPTAEARRRGKVNASDSKGSGAPEEAADLLIIMEWPNQTEDPETLWMRWPAFRHGPAGEMVHGEVSWDGRALLVVESATAGAHQR